MMLRTLSILFALVLPLSAANCADDAKNLANLIEPAKLATLGPRGANPRIQKAAVILAETEADELQASTDWPTAIEMRKRRCNQPPLN